MPQRSQVDLKAIDQFLEFLDFNHEHMTSLRPGSVFHYTDLSGLKGIVENHDLWLTNSQYCNDEEELKHGYSVAKDALGKAKTAGLHSPAYLDKIGEFLEQREGVFICCFCDKDNLLSQWRTYAGNGTGVSLQFNPNSFANFTGGDCPVGLARFWKVYYDRPKQEYIVESALQHFHPPPGAAAGDTEDRARQAADSIKFFIPTFKNISFSEENEWRLIFTPSSEPPPGGPAIPPPRFRVSRNMLVPYYSLQDIRLATAPAAPPVLLPIVGVKVGPSPNKLLNQHSLRTLLQQRGYPTNLVDTSEIPYRV
jgi:hypothetical protein